MINFFLKNIDKSSIEKYINEVMLSLDNDTFKRIHNIYPDILSDNSYDPDILLLLRYIFIGIYNEDIPYSIFNTRYSGSNIILDGTWDDLAEGTFAKYKYLETLKELWALYGVYGYRLKQKKLRELYNIRVYHGVENKFSYKDISNITNEFERILNSEELSFLRSISSTPVLELLNINEIEALMLSTNRVILYSAFLNFDEVSSTLLSKILELSELSNTIITADNWEKYSTMFRNILKKLDIQLVHY